VRRYIGTKEIEAEPQEKDGREGYAVRYPDGYVSWSPKEAFEAAYELAEGEAQLLSFGDAVHFLKAGRRVSRAGWNGKGMWLALQRPDECCSLMDLPFVYMRTVQGHLVPWLASQTDILAEDWSVLE
jgi:hypothetical protein